MSWRTFLWLRSRDFQKRLAAIREMPVEPNEKLTTRLLNDPVSNVRSAFLHRFGTRIAYGETRSHILKLLVNDPVPFVRGAAALAFLNSADDQEVIQTLKQALQEHHPEVCIAASAALCSALTWEIRDRRATPAVSVLTEKCAALNIPVERLRLLVNKGASFGIVEIRRLCVGLLGEFGTKDAIPILRERLHDPDPKVREYAEDSLSWLQSRLA